MKEIHQKESLDQDTIVQALLKPETYPNHPQKITHLQTHISHIFLTGGLVYKIKKPVNFHFLDFSTLSKRRYFCHQEVELNRRLARDIYLGVVKITLDKGKPSLNGKGPVVEYAVAMREMPQERMMNRLLKSGKVEPREIKALVRRLVPFYATARTGRGVNAYGLPKGIAKNTEENFEQTRSYVGRLISSRAYRRIWAYSRSFLERNRDLFNRRIKEGRIRDCHGDLHSGNICLTKEIQVYDCIEFNPRFRYSDTACDLAFLAMDLDFHGYENLSDTLVKSYVRQSGDKHLPRLMDFYKCYRAHVRAKIHSLASVEPEISFKEKRDHIQLAKNYYQLAHRYALNDKPPRLIVFFGLMGSGKTSLARAFAKKTGWPLYSSDEIRKKLAGLNPSARRWEPFGEGIYSQKMSEKTYWKMRQEAEQLLKKGQSVILDASYSQESERLPLVHLAGRTGARLHFIECRVPLAVIRRRLNRRSQEKAAVSDGRWEIFKQQRLAFDPVSGPDRDHLITIRTTQSPETLSARLLKKIGLPPHFCSKQ